MPRKPAVVAAESVRPKIERKAKADASQRMGGKLESLKAIPVETKKAPATPKKKSGKLLKPQSYKSMVKKAITENANRKGTSLAAIASYIQANYDVKDTFRRYLKAAIARQVTAGLLVKKSPARYALTAKAKKPKKAKKATKKSTKKDTKKTTKKTATGEKKTRKTADKKKATTKTTKAATRKAGKGVEKVKATRTKKAAAEKPVKKTAARGKAKATSSSAGASETSGDNSTLVWVWQYYDNGFFNYDSAASDVVEGVYQEYLTSPYTCDVRAVKSGQWEYEIDFRVMTQRNLKHAAHTTRKIRRIQIAASEKNDTNKRYEGTVEDTN